MILLLHPIWTSRLYRLVEFHLTVVELDSGKAISLRLVIAEGFHLHGAGNPTSISR